MCWAYKAHTHSVQIRVYAHTFDSPISQLIISDTAHAGGWNVLQQPIKPFENLHVFTHGSLDTKSHFDLSVYEEFFLMLSVSASKMWTWGSCIVSAWDFPNIAELLILLTMFHFSSSFFHATMVICCLHLRCKMCIKSSSKDGCTGGEYSTWNVSSPMWKNMLYFMLVV